MVLNSGDESQRRLSIGWNVFWTLVGNVIYAGSQWMMLVELAKLGSPSMVGEYTFGLAVTAPVVLGANMQLRNVQVTDAAQEHSYTAYFSTRILTTVSAIAVIVLLAGLIPHKNPLVICLIGMAKAIEAISDIAYGLFQQEQRMDYQGRSLILRGMLSVSIAGILLWISGSLVMFTAGVAVSWALVLVLHDLQHLRRMLSQTPHRMSQRMFSFDLRAAKSILPAAIPLGIVSLIWSVALNIPRYLIEGHLGSAQLGVYAALYYVVTAGNVVVNAVGQAYVPHLARSAADGEARRFAKSLVFLSLTGLMLGAVATTFAVFQGRWFLTIVYTAEYGNYAGLFASLMFAGGIGYASSFLVLGMHAVRQHKVQLPLYVCVATASLLCGWWLIPRYELFGAALTNMVQMTCLGLGAIVVIATGVKKRDYPQAYMDE